KPASRLRGSGGGAQARVGQMGGQQGGGGGAYEIGSGRRAAVTGELQGDQAVGGAPGRVRQRVRVGNAVGGRQEAGREQGGDGFPDGLESRAGPGNALGRRNVPGER